MFSKALNFDLCIHHPRDCLHATYLEYKQSLDSISPPTSEISVLRRAWKAAAETTMRKLECSSACLTHTPSEIAVGCLLISEPQTLAGSLAEFLNSRFEPVKLSYLYLSEKQIETYHN